MAIWLLILCFSFAFALEPCTENDVGHFYSKCTGNTRSAVYYYLRECDQSGYELPQPIRNLPCDIPCPPGSHLPFGTTECQICEPGYYSIGGGQIYSSWNVWPEGFSTDCTGFECGKWSLNGTYIFSGENPWNSVSSNFKVRAQFVNPTANSIKFEYQVDSEACAHAFCDGLRFYIDEKLMFETSHKIFWTTYETTVTPGFHLFRWEYVKDILYSVGRDAAFIRSLVLIGTEGALEQCAPCLEGYFSDRNSSSCQPCPYSTFSNSTASTYCSECPAGQTSLKGSSSCYTLRSCTKDDYFYRRSSCSSEFTETKSYVYDGVHELVKICNPALPNSVPLPNSVVGTCRCPPGTQFDTSLGACNYCPKGYAKSGWTDYHVPCSMCLAGTAAIKTLYYADWSYLPADFTTECEGDCGSDGWVPRGGYISSGFGNGQQVVSTLSTSVSITSEGGRVLMNYDLANCGYSFYFSTCYLQLFVESDFEDLIGYQIPPGMNQTRYLDLLPGNYNLTWKYTHNSPNPTEGTNSKIYWISISGSVVGGGIECESCPAGSEAPNDESDTCVPCQPGFYSPNESSNCIQVPDGSYTNKPGSTTPLECGPNTSSNLYRTDCETDCMFSPIPNVEYDLNPFYDSGNLYFAGTDSYQTAFYLTLCLRQQGSRTCFDQDGNELDTFGCAKPPLSESATDLGRIIGYLPPTLDLNDTETLKSGLIVTLTGGSPCTSGSSTLTSSKISLTCDPSIGVGIPQYQRYDSTTCTYHFNWISQYACPVCTRSDYQAISSDCINGTITKSYVRLSRCWEKDPMVSSTTDCISCPTISEDIICSGKGVCDYVSGRCHCEANWGGPDCSDCKNTFYGEGCEKQCYMEGNFVCSGHGKCDSGLNGTGECLCSTGFTPPQCDQCLEGFEGATCNPIPATVTDVVPWYGFAAIGIVILVIGGLILFLWRQKKNTEARYEALVNQGMDGTSNTDHFPDDLSEGQIEEQ